MAVYRIRTCLGIIGVALWFGANFLLWYVRPHELLWLAGSAVLAAVGVKGFLYYIIGNRA
jgi:hypothetical protein